VDEAWRIVGPVLKAGTQIHEYEEGAWAREISASRPKPAEAGIAENQRFR
jgi:hypothetical protein